MQEILSLISQFGPLIVLAGTFFEGEVFAIIGGFLAYRGTYPFQLVVALAFVGSFFGDLAVFLFGRYASNHRWVRPWRDHPKFSKTLRLVERYQAYFVIVNRYIYGLRMPGLIALGMSRVGLVRFTVLNFIGAGLWACLFTTLGYVFGYSIQTLFARMQIFETGVIIVLVVAAVSIAAYFGYRQWGPIIRARLARRREKARARNQSISENES
ncbi:DedA family protein [Fulvimarina sp. MAC3]|uniref:DedA family protein n=1 Tax=Fulvimarina sp. MAC3 TaxID=3148887 RepID=UPI0031FD9C90